MAWPNVYNLDASKFSSDTAKREQKASIVLVHDAFHTAFHFEHLVRELRRADVDCLLPQLPSSYSTSQSNPFQADVQAIYDHSKLAIDTGQNLIFVLHGYGALPGSIAAENLNGHALGRPGAGFVVKLIFISGIIANQGECVLDVLRPGWLMHENTLLRAQRPQAIFFGDCSPRTARIAVNMIRSQLAESFQFRINNLGWTLIPCVYVICELDQAMPQDIQQACVQKLTALNRHTTALTLRCGHSPHLSQPQELAALILRMASGSQV